MSDIVERLRARKEPNIEYDLHYPQIVDSDIPDAECLEAATRIAQLESELSDALTDLNTARQDNASCTVHIHNQAARIEALEAALREIAAIKTYSEVSTAIKAADIARAALEDRT